jgi:hypothetical protein
MSVGLTRLIRPLALMTLIKNLGRHSVGHCDITQSSSRITSTSGVCSGAIPGRPLEWPHPGGVIINSGPHRPVVPGGPALRMSMPAPLGRGTGD